MKSFLVFGTVVLCRAVQTMLFVVGWLAFSPPASAQLTVTLSSTEPDPTNVSPFRVRARFSGPVSGFDPSDLVITNAAVSSFPGGGPNYSIWLTPDADGLITVDIPAGVALDMSGNPNQAATQFSIVYDSTSPTVASISASDPNPTNASTVRFTVLFSEPVVGVDLTDLGLVTTGAISGATIDSLTGGGVAYIATVSGLTQEGTVQLVLTDDDTILDDATNLLGGTGAGNGDFNAGETYTIDKTPPTIAVGGPSVALTNTGPVSFAVTYSGADAVSLSPGDVTLNTTGGATGNVSVTGSGTALRTVTLDAITGDGSIGISVAAGTASDAAGNTAAGGGPSATFAVDNTSPVVTVDLLTTNDTSPSLTGSVDDALAVISITVSGQTNGALNAGDGTWTLPDNTFTLLAPGPHDVQVTATDLAGNAGVDGTADELLIVAGAGGGVIVSNLPPEETFEGVRLVLSAPAGGTNYQWFKEGVPLTDGVRISGVDTRSLVMDPAELGDAGSFTTQYENGVAKAYVETEPFPLVVLPLPPPLSAGRALAYVVVAGILILSVARYRTALLSSSGRTARS